MYHLYKLVNNNKEQIVACVLPIGRHKQFYLSCDLCEMANNNKLVFFLQQMVLIATAGFYNIFWQQVVQFF